MFNYASCPVSVNNPGVHTHIGNLGDFPLPKCLNVNSNICTDYTLGYSNNILLYLLLTPSLKDMECTHKHPTNLMRLAITHLYIVKCCILSYSLISFWVHPVEKMLVRRGNMLLRWNNVISNQQTSRQQN